MAGLVSYLLVVWGLCYLLTTSVLCRPPRVLISKLGALARTLVYCRACTGFWIGLVLGLCDFPPNLPIAALPAAIAAMGLCAICSELVPNYAYKAEQEPEPAATGRTFTFPQSQGEMCSHCHAPAGMHEAGCELAQLLRDLEDERRRGAALQIEEIERSVRASLAGGDERGSS